VARNLLAAALRVFSLGMRWL